jgi:hypothetical protein
VESVEDQLGATVATGVPGAVAVAVGTGERVEAAVGFADLRTGEALPIEVRLRFARSHDDFDRIIGCRMERISTSRRL